MVGMTSISLLYFTQQHPRANVSFTYRMLLAYFGRSGFGWQLTRSEAKSGWPRSKHHVVVHALGGQNVPIVPSPCNQTE